MALLTVEKSKKGKESGRNLRTLVNDTSKALTELEMDVDNLIAQHDQSWKDLEK